MASMGTGVEETQLVTHLWTRCQKTSNFLTEGEVFSFLFFFFFFLNHIFIVSTVQEMTCIFNDMAKTKPKIKLTINK